MKPVGGRVDHPMNCVARWQAEAYCSWAGKRLPTDVEWEYAARSGKEEYDCPYGPEEHYCQGLPKSRITPPSNRPRYPKGSKGGTWPVCTVSSTNSAQGLCDMMGNVTEFVEQIELEGRRTNWFDGCRGDDWSGNAADMTFRYTHCDPWQRDESVGFRCSRSVTETRGSEVRR